LADDFSALQGCQNLVEKVNAKKIDVTLPHHKVFGRWYVVKEDLNQESNVKWIWKV
jgi:hypothetical protein